MVRTTCTTAIHPSVGYTDRHPAILMGGRAAAQSNVHSCTAPLQYGYLSVLPSQNLVTTATCNRKPLSTPGHTTHSEPTKQIGSNRQTTAVPGGPALELALRQRRDTRWQPSTRPVGKPRASLKEHTCTRTHSAVHTDTARKLRAGIRCRTAYWICGPAVPYPSTPCKQPWCGDTGRQRHTRASLQGEPT